MGYVNVVIDGQPHHGTASVVAPPVASGEIMLQTGDGLLVVANINDLALAPRRPAGVPPPAVGGPAPTADEPTPDLPQRTRPATAPAPAIEGQILAPVRPGDNAHAAQRAELASVLAAKVNGDLTDNDNAYQNDDAIYLGGTDPESLDPYNETPQPYIDWATEFKGDHAWEIGNEEGETLAFTMSRPEMEQLASAIAVTLLRDTIPETPIDPNDPQSVLLASLRHAGQHGAAWIADEPDSEEHTGGRYFDFSTRSRTGDGYIVEAGVDGDAIQLEMTREQFERWHAQITRTIIKEWPND